MKCHTIIQIFGMIANCEMFCSMAFCCRKMHVNRKEVDKKYLEKQEDYLEEKWKNISIKLLK